MHAQPMSCTWLMFYHGHSLPTTACARAAAESALDALRMCNDCWPQLVLTCLLPSSKGLHVRRPHGARCHEIMTKTMGCDDRTCCNKCRMGTSLTFRRGESRGLTSSNSYIVATRAVTQPTCPMHVRNQSVDNHHKPPKLWAP